MQQNVLQQKCKHNKSEIVSFDLDLLAELKDRYLCLGCLNTSSPYRQSQLIKDAQQIFKEMTISEFNSKKKQKIMNIEKLQNILKQMKESQEFILNRISESIKTLNKKISQVQNELKSFIEPSCEMQTEQDLINLSNYVNFGSSKNLNNQTNPQNYEFIEQIQQLLDYSKFEEHLMSISNSLESIFTQSLIVEPVKHNPLNQLQIDFTKLKYLRFQCSIHKSEITMICLEPGQIKHRFFCSNCMKDKNQQQLYTIQDVNKLWQSHIQNIQLSNKDFYTLRQDNQNEVIELIFQYQKFNQEFFNGLHKQVINQNNKIIKEKNDLQSSILNKQLFQMEFKEIEQITQTLSHDQMQEVRQKQFQIQKEDKLFKDQILEQLNIQRKKLMEFSLKINKLFQLDLSIKELNQDQLEQYFFQKLFPQFYDNYTKFLNQYKLIIDYVKSKFEKSQIKNKNQQLNHQSENQTLQYKKILEQILQIEKIQLKQVSLSIDNLHFDFQYQIKRSQNTLTTQNFHVQQKYQIQRSIKNLTIQNSHIKKNIQINHSQNKLSTNSHHIELKFQIKSPLKNFSFTNLVIQQKYQIQLNIQLKINTIINDYTKIYLNSWFIYKKKLKFSDQQKHSTLKLSSDRKIASAINNNQIYAACLCDQPIPQSGSFFIDFKINQLYQIIIGICEFNKINQQNYKFDNKNQIGHGFYVLDNYGQIFSHHDSSKNQKNLGFEFNVGDIINIEVNQLKKQIIWRNQVTSQLYGLEFQSSEDLYFCCVLYSANNKISEVQII